MGRRGKCVQKNMGQQVEMKRRVLSDTCSSLTGPLNRDNGHSLQCFFRSQFASDVGSVYVHPEVQALAKGNRVNQTLSES